MRKLFIILFGVTSLFAAKPTPPKFLSVEPIKTMWVSAGKSFETTVTVKVEPPFHIQANPVSQPNLIPTTIEFAEKEGVSLEAVTYPEGKVFRLENSDKDLMVYGGEAKFKVKFSTAKAKPGKVDLVGTFRFQPCNDKICFFPTRLPLNVTVQVMK